MHTSLVTDGISSLWPDINDIFLSLKGIPQDITPNSMSQNIYKQLLIGFDSITTCELKNFYKFKLTLEQMDQSEISRPEIKLIYQAFIAWVHFDYEKARLLLTQHIQMYSTDIIAIFFHHMLDFCTGKTANQSQLLDYCDAHIPKTHYLYSYYLAIRSFVLCENCEFNSTLLLGLDSVRLIPDNIYGIHAIAHALHELGHWKELCQFLTHSKENWINNAGMRMHVYWHLAIAYERSNEITLAIQTFNQLYALKDNPFAKQDLDAVSFLWRLRLKSADTSFTHIWERLAVLWTGSIGTSTSYFHKIHAALAFSACQQPFLIEKLISECDGFGVEAETHSTGMHVLNAILLFTNQQYLECHDNLNNCRDKWSLLGGSRAQREILSLTMEYAAQSISTMVA